MPRKRTDLTDGKVISFRLTAAESALLDQTASAHGLTPSLWMRTNLIPLLTGHGAHYPSGEPPMNLRDPLPELILQDSASPLGLEALPPPNTQEESLAVLPPTPSAAPTEWVGLEEAQISVSLMTGTLELSSTSIDEEATGNTTTPPAPQAH